MATLKKRLHKFNGSGYDTIYFETLASCVKIDNTENTVLDSLNSLTAGLSTKMPIYDFHGTNRGEASSIAETCIMIATFTDYPSAGAAASYNDGQGTVITYFYGGGWRRQIWISPHGGSLYQRTSAGPEVKYGDWLTIYDSSNLSSHTLGALWAGGRMANTDELNNPNYPYPYMTTVYDQHAAAIGLPGRWYHLLNFRHWDNNGFNAQLAISLNGGYPDIRVRNSEGTTWTGWKRIPLVDYGTSAPGALTDGQIYCIYE